MYNRYVPQSDGSYRRNQIPENRKMPNQPPVKPQEPPQIAPPCPQQPPNPARPVSITGFLKQILPKNFDSNDLLVVILLLLMSGDCQEEQNTALLTLVLYLFM